VGPDVSEMVTHLTIPCFSAQSLFLRVKDQAEEHDEEEEEEEEKIKKLKKKKKKKPWFQ
jgi:hypothetical protein